MKRILAFIILSIQILAVLAQQNPVTIKIDIKGESATDTLTFSWGAVNKSTIPLITQCAARDTSVLAIPINEPRLIVVRMKGYQGEFELMASPAEQISISGKITKDETGKKPLVNFRHIRIKGASRQDEYQKIVNTYESHQDSIDAQVARTFRGVRQTIKSAKTYKNEQAIADLYATLDGQIYVQTVQATYDMKQRYMLETVLKLSDSFYGPLMLLRCGGRLDKTYQPVYDEMSETAQQSCYGREVKDEVYPPSLIGELAPTVKVFNMTGDDKLLNFAHHGSKYLLVDFWASWCGPCIKEVPNLKELYEKYHSQGLDIIGISADLDKTAWLETLEELEEPWCNYIDTDKQAIMEYKVQYIPSIFILNNKGEVIAEKLRGKELSNYITNLFVKD